MAYQFKAKVAIVFHRGTKIVPSDGVEIEGEYATERKSAHIVSSGNKGCQCIQWMNLSFYKIEDSRKGLHGSMYDIVAAQKCQLARSCEIQM